MCKKVQKIITTEFCVFPNIYESLSLNSMNWHEDLLKASSCSSGGDKYLVSNITDTKVPCTKV